MEREAGKGEREGNGEGEGHVKACLPLQRSSRKRDREGGRDGWQNLFLKGGHSTCAQTM